MSPCRFCGEYFVNEHTCGSTAISTSIEVEDIGEFIWQKDIRALTKAIKELTKAITPQSSGSYKPKAGQSNKKRVKQTKDKPVGG